MVQVPYLQTLMVTVRQLQLQRSATRPGILGLALAQCFVNAQRVCVAHVV